MSPRRDARVLRLPRVFYGWWVVAAAVAVNILTSAVYIYGFSAFFVPWREAFGWSRAQISGVIGLSRLEGGLVAPLGGWLVDKYGPRKMMFIGLALMGLGFMAISRINSLTALYIVFLGLLSAGSSLGGGRPVQIAAANWFIRRRGRVMGLLAAGYAGGGSLVFLFAMVIHSYGWRVAAIVAGLLIWFIGFPLALVIRHRPEQMGLLPDGDGFRKGGNPALLEEANKVSAANRTPLRPEINIHGEESPKLRLPQLPRIMRRDPRPEIDLTPWQALRTLAFWLMVITTACWAAVPAIHTVHFIPFLVEELHMEYVAAAGVLSFFSIVSVFGRIGFGFLADYVNVRLLAMSLLAAEGVGIFLVSQAHTLSQMLVSTAVFAIAHGGVLVMWPVLQGYLFGRKSFGTIGGFSAFIQLPASVTAPIWVGYAADSVSGGYRLAFAVIAFMLLGAAISVSFMRRPREPLPANEPPLLWHLLRRSSSKDTTEEGVAGLPKR